MSLKEPLGGKERPQNVTDIFQRLSHVVQALSAEAIPLERAKEISNASGKMLKAVAIKLEYAHMRKDESEIPEAK